MFCLLNGSIHEILIFLLALQGKDLVAKVIVDVFSVIKLAKIVKITFTKTFFFGRGCFCGL
jgi:hypothetical protein